MSNPNLGQGVRGRTVGRVFQALLLVLGTMTLQASSGESSGDGPFQWFPFLAPFHSVVLHLPIGFVIMAFIMDLYSMKRPGREIRKLISFCLGLCALSAVLAITLGLMRAMGGGYDDKALSLHKWYGIAVGVITILACWVHHLAFVEGIEKSPAAKTGFRIIMGGNIAVLAIAGHLGGNLTYGSEYLVANAPSFVKEMLGEKSDKPAQPVAAAEKTEEGGESSMSLGERLFVDHVKPAFEAKCHRCHGTEKQKGGYTLKDRESALMAGDSDEPGIVPGDPMKSYLVSLISLNEEADDVMPPSGKEQLTPEEVGYIVRWIAEGAPFVE